MKGYNSNVRLHLKRVIGRDYISKEQYSALIEAYKKYDTIQKRRIDQYLSEINNMSKKLVKYEKIVTDIENLKLLDKYSKTESIEELCSFIKEYDSKKEKLSKLSKYISQSRYFERLWIDEVYPQYRETNISTDKLKRIAEILEEE